MKAIRLVPILALAIFIGCRQQSDEPATVARFLIGPLPAGAEVVRAHLYRHRHPDAPSFVYLDMRMDDRAFKEIAGEHAMTPVDPAKLKSANWPRDLAPVQTPVASMAANPLFVLIQEGNSRRVVALSLAYFPKWYEEGSASPSPSSATRH